MILEFFLKELEVQGRKEIMENHIKIKIYSFKGFIVSPNCFIIKFLKYFIIKFTFIKRIIEHILYENKEWFPFYSNSVILT